TIEKAVKASPTSDYTTVSGYVQQIAQVPNTSVNTNHSATGTNGAATNDDHFTLHIYNNATNNIDGRTTYVGAVNLEQELRGFFQRTQVDNSIVSMDDNGLGGYDLRFALANPTSTEANWLELNESTGVISVKESTAGFYNTAALGQYTIVRV